MMSRWMTMTIDRSIYWLANLSSPMTYPKQRFFQTQQLGGVKSILEHKRSRLTSMGAAKTPALKLITDFFHWNTSTIVVAT